MLMISRLCLLLDHSRIHSFKKTIISTNVGKDRAVGSNYNEKSPRN